MEHREAPPLLFAYLGRRDCRFVLNRAGVVPLTGFLCVYPFDSSPAAVEQLWRVLNHPDTISNLAFAAKSYGSGALKAEPRQLDGLLIPRHVLKEIGMGLPGFSRRFKRVDDPKLPGPPAGARLRRIERTKRSTKAVA
jgi:hypothetical protein